MPVAQFMQSKCRPLFSQVSSTALH